MNPHEQGTGWSTLEANAHLEDVQEIIRSEISRGMIRVVPSRGGGIRIIPIVGHSAPAPAFPEFRLVMSPEDSDLLALEA